MDLSSALRALEANLGRVILGKPGAVRLLLTALLARGHALIEDVPGVGKTALARALARSIAGTFRRIQFTPDLLPADITGFSVYDPSAQAFSFKPGPVFANLVLADEINRATPRTQSALLEAMNEGSVSVDGATHGLPSPFLVVATQNPIEYTGTYPLPESELDRFLLSFSLGYPDREAEIEMLRSRRAADPLELLAPALSAAEAACAAEAALAVRVDDSLQGYIRDLGEHTRKNRDLLAGASPRALLHLLRASQASAFLNGRGFATPDDIQACAVPVLAHRLIPRNRRGAAGAAAAGRDAAAQAVEEVAAPR